MVLGPGCLLQYFGDLVSVQTSLYNYSFSQTRRETEREIPLHMAESLKSWFPLRMMESFFHEGTSSGAVAVLPAPALVTGGLNTNIQLPRLE